MAENAYELIIRGKNELGPALAEASGQLRQFGATTAASTAAVRPEFEAVRERLKQIADQAQRTGRVGAESINQLKISLQQLSQIQQSTLSGAERNIFASATKTLPDAIRMTQQYNAVAKETAVQVGAGSTAMGTFRTVLTSMVPALTAVGAAFAALNIVKSSLKEFSEAEAGVRALSASLETIGADVDKVVPKIEEMISAWERASVFDDDELRAGLTTLITITGDVAASASVMQAAMDLSAARGMSLTSATELLGRALEGNVLQLTRMGIKFNEADQAVFKYGNEVDRAAILTEKLRESMGGRATAQIDTFAGKVKLVENAWQDAKKSLGGFLIEGLAGIVRFGERVGVLADQIGNYFRIMRGQAPIDIRSYGVESGGRTSIGVAEAADAARRRGEQAEKDIETARRTKKAMEEAAAAAIAYAAALDQLTGNGKAVAREQQLIADALKIVTRQLGGDFGRAVQAFAPQLARIRDAAKESGGAIRTDLVPAIKELEEQLRATRLGELLSDLEKLNRDWVTRELGRKIELSVEAKQDSFRRAGIVVGEEAAREIEAAGRRLAEDLEHASRTFTEPLGDIFSDAFITGGKNFGNIAAGILQDQAKAMGSTIADLITVGLGALTGEGTRIDPRTGRPVLERDSTARQIGGGLLAGAASGYGLYRSQVDAAQAMRSQDIGIQANLTALSTYLSSGSWVAAIVAGVVTAVVGHLGQAEARDLYKYAVPGIDVTGRATLTERNRNIREADANRMIAQVQERFDLVWNGMVRIVSTFADSLPELVKTIDGRFQGAASAYYLQHFDSWLADTLPREIVGRFRESLSGIAESLGFSTARFEEIWDHLEQLDPTKAAALWGALFIAAKQFQETLEFFRTPLNTTVGGGLDIQPGLLQQTFEDMNRTFGETLREADDNIVRLGWAMANMTGEAQIQAAQELGALLTERMQREKAFLQEIIAGIESIKTSFGASIRELELEGLRTAEGKPDIEAQAQYLQDYADSLIEQLRQAPDVQSALALSQEIQGTIMRIRQLGGSISPEANEAYRLWAIENLERVQQIAIDRMNQLAQEVENANARFLDAIEGFIDAFLRATDGLNEAVPGEQPPGTPPGETPPPDTDTARRGRGSGTDTGENPVYREGESVGKPSELTKPGYGEGATAAETLKEIRDLLTLRRDEERISAEQTVAVLREQLEEMRAGTEAERATAIRLLALMERGVEVSGETMVRVVVEDGRTGQPQADFTQRVQQTRQTRGRRSA